MSSMNGQQQQQHDPFGDINATMNSMNMGGGSSSMPSSSSFGSFGEMMGGGVPTSSNFGSTSSSSSKKRPRTLEYDSIPTGTLVRLKGLVNKPERNGDRGRIVQYDPASERYVVQMIDDD